jgi:hypothetical protein
MIGGKLTGRRRAVKKLKNGKRKKSGAEVFSSALLLKYK